MNVNDHRGIQNKVREHYGKVAKGKTGPCCNPHVKCCGDADMAVLAGELSKGLGYSNGQLKTVPENSNLGLGCGNPIAIAELKEGETVLDLGSGGGFDCFLASQKVGSAGQVIGVDVTPEMVALARKNAASGKFENVEFRYGEIERLPITGESIDAIMSNCVINLSPDKQRVFAEAYRVLKRGGRLTVFDVVAVAPLPEQIATDLEAYVGCVAGAMLIDDLVDILESVGFTGVSVEPQCQSREYIREWMPGMHVEDYVVSAVIRAVKPL
ncbi:MAG: arsenite S-adenosylmethyltransferase [candidate division Zixibacteria bacterium HGW-Zixibacteria-1]|nr:MAG: arsenite S-adenosylmethyltransferase [candidate division Zixibacteria bacterium HGW-Zixibacteria-1]